ncbi:hypothetical protein BN979_00792 [Mycolicibacterium vulneris]|nr:hypothetical protein BN979_00792 [Mycolicibacterium vulneris]
MTKACEAAGLGSPEFAEAISKGTKPDVKPEP